MWIFPVPKRAFLQESDQYLESGDTLAVWQLDRLGRSMPRLVRLVEKLLGKGIGFRSLHDGGIDITTTSGEPRLSSDKRYFVNFRN